MIAALVPYLIRGIPMEARVGLADHSLRLFGSVIRDAATGRIVYHLQEAAPLVGQLAGLASMPGLAIAGEAVSIVQNEVNRRALRELGARAAALKDLAQMNLAVSAAGIGVSAVGFAIVAQRLDHIEDSIRELDDKIDRVISLIDEAARRETQDLLSDVRGLAELYENSWALTDSGRAKNDLQRIWQDGSTLQDRSEARARHALTNSSLSYEAARPYLDSFALISGLRIAALLACDEIEVAKRIEKDSAEKMQRMTGAFGMVELISSEMREEGNPGSSEWSIAKARASTAAKPVVAEIRFREQALATRTASLPLLGIAGVRPREWMEEARNEKEAEVLCLGAQPTTNPNTAPRSTRRSRRSD